MAAIASLSSPPETRQESAVVVIRTGCPPPQRNPKRDGFLWTVLNLLGKIDG